MSHNHGQRVLNKSRILDEKNDAVRNASPVQTFHAVERKHHGLTGMQTLVRHWFRAEIALALSVALLGLFLLIVPLEHYEWIKALHVVAVIGWMAGMLYLPRLFVYHCDAPQGSIQSETFKVMERRLLKAIINPAMIAVWVLGLILVWQGGWITSGWLHAKILLVLILSGVHGMLSRAVKTFAADKNVRPARYYRIL